jgi:nucleoside-diphosphate kinase
MIKPDAFSNGHSGAILDIMLKAGFKLIALKMTHLSPEKAGEFYAVHKARPFYGELVEFMSRGPITAAILEKENAVEDFRKLIGATNPANAEPGTIRKLYAASVGENAIHGSDSDANAETPWCVRTTSNAGSGNPGANLAHQPLHREQRFHRAAIQ